MKTLFTSNFNRAPLGLLLAAVAILVFEGFQVLFAPYFYLEKIAEADLGKLSRYGLLRVETKHRISLAGDLPVDIIVVGDSGGMVGIDPSVIEAVSPYRAMNYSGFASDGTIAGYMMLRNHLRTSPRPPKLLVLYFTELTFRRKKPRGGYELQYANGDRQTLIADIGTGAWLRAQLPSVRHQATLKKVFKSPSILGDIDPDAVRAVVDETYHAKGYVPYGLKRDYRGHPPKQAPSETAMQILGLSAQIEVSAHVEKYLRGIIETGLQAGLRVVLIAGARPREWYEYDAKAPATRNIQALYEALEQDYPELIVEDVQSIIGDHSNFVDQYHMNPRGSKLLSEHIATKLMPPGA